MSTLQRTQLCFQFSALSSNPCTISITLKQKVNWRKTAWTLPFLEMLVGLKSCKRFTWIGVAIVISVPLKFFNCIKLLLFQTLHFFLWENFFSFIYARWRMYDAWIVNKSSVRHPNIIIIHESKSSIFQWRTVVFLWAVSSFGNSVRMHIRTAASSGFFFQKERASILFTLIRAHARDLVQERTTDCYIRWDPRMVGRPTASSGITVLGK